MPFAASIVAIRHSCIHNQRVCRSRKVGSPPEELLGKPWLEHPLLPVNQLPVNQLPDKQQVGSPPEGLLGKRWLEHPLQGVNQLPGKQQVATPDKQQVATPDKSPVEQAANPREVLGVKAVSVCSPWAI